MELAAAIAAALSALAALAALVVAKRSLDTSKVSAQAGEASARAGEASARAGEESAVHSKRSADAAEETLRMAKEQREADRRHAVGLALVSVKRGGDGRFLVYRFSAISFRESVSHVVISILDESKNELGTLGRGVNITVGTPQELAVTVPTRMIKPKMQAQARWLDRETQKEMCRISIVEVPATETGEPSV